MNLWRNQQTIAVSSAERKLNEWVTEPMSEDRFQSPSVHDVAYEMKS